MTRKKFNILNSLYNLSIGRTPIFSDLQLNDAIDDNHAMDELVEEGYIDQAFGNITQKGMQVLKPYKVDGAVILAAGPSTRLIPLSLETPKALLEARGERLIERQIKQLQEAGIKDITIVLGYKKEMFYYLADKYQVKFIENDDFIKKNNTHSILLAKEKLGNSYICSCDDYFVENPFNQYEYESFYAGIHVNSKTDEIYVITDEDGKIYCMVQDLCEGMVLLGHSFWRADFAKKVVEILESDVEGKYDHVFWEFMVRDYLHVLPSFYFKKYAKRAIYEFDFFEELRRFDSAYIKNTHSKIISNITSVFHCEESDIQDFRNVSEGMTNTSFIFRIKGVDYIYRHPGDGTEKIIVRDNERRSLEIAKEWKIDPTYVYMDVKEGWKISVFVTEFREPEYDDFEDSKKVLGVLRELHKLPIEVDYGLKPWEDAEAMEKLLVEKNPACFAKHEPLKEMIHQLYEKTQGDGVEKCFCHGDTYKPNWMVKPNGDVILIDWEYSGYSDPGIDVGYYIVDAMYDIDLAKAFIAEYLQDDADETKEFHFMAYTAIIAYYWFVWAMYRESCGASMGDALTNWRDMAEKYAEYLLH